MKTVKKALAVLDTFTQDLPTQGVTEIARKLGLHKSTTFSILSALRDAGYVIHESSTRRYSLGFKIFELAGRIQHRKDLKDLSLPIIQTLSNTIEEDVALNILIEGRRVCIALVESRYFVRHLVPIGKPLPVHCSAAGKAILAHLPSEEIDGIITRYGLPAFTANTITDKENLLAELGKIRGSGYAESREEFGKDAASLAFPIFDAKQKIIASLSIQSTVNRLKRTTRSRFVKEGIHASTAISDLLATVSK